MKRRGFLIGASATTVFTALLRRLGVRAEAVAIPRRTLGQTGERISCIGLGGAHIGMQRDKQDSIRIIRTAIDRGINFLDNCWDYHDGESERRMGEALRDGYRQRAFLMTKIDGRERTAAAKQIDDSLRRLQTDHLDLLQFHEIIRTSDPERVFGHGGALEAALAARQAGKVRYLGFTGHKSPHIHLQMLATAAAHDFVFDTAQMPLNVMDAHHDSFEKLVLPELLRRKIGVIGMKPIGGGKFLESKTISAAECLHYALSLPTDVVITGCDSLPVLEQALSVAAVWKPLDGGERAELLAKTERAARNGRYELYKSSQHFDGTARHPEWLG